MDAPQPRRDRSRRRIGLLLAGCLCTSGAAATPQDVTLDELSIAGEARPRRTPPTAAIGQPPPAHAGGQVATGQRVGLFGDRPAMETPFSVTSYTAQYIQDQQARTLSDILASDPSVRAATPRFGFSDQISVRGFTLNGGDASLDGIGGIAPPRRLPFDSVERVELIRGPGAMLTGIPPGANIGGSLNYALKRATDAPITRVTPGFIGDGNVGTAVDVGRRFGADNAWGLRINGSVRDGATPLDGETERLANVAAALDYRGDRVRFSLDGGSFAFRQQTYSQVILSLAPGALVPKAPPATTTLSPPWQRIPIESVYGLGRVEFDILDNTTLGFGYGRSYTTERSVQTLLTNLRTTGDVTATPSAFPFWARKDGADASLRTRFETGPLTHEVAAIGNLVAIRQSTPQSLADVTVIGRATTQNVYRPFAVPEPSVAGVDFFPSKTGQTLLASAGIADVISALDGRVQLTVGGRQQRIENETFSIATGARTSRSVAEAFTPAYGLLVRPVDAVSLYANYIQGLVQGPTAPAGARNGGQILPPALAEQYEIGAKLDLGGFGAQLALFQIAQQSGAVDPATNLFGFIGLQRNRGAEIQVFGEAAPGLRLLGGVAFIDARLVATPGGSNDGRKAPGVPDAAVSFQAEYDPRILPGLTLFGRAIYTDPVYFDAANRQRLPDWIRFDLGLRYAALVGGRSVVFRAAVENVTDVSYWQTAGRSLLSLGSPRTILVSASFDL